MPYDSQSSKWSEIVRNIANKLIVEADLDPSCVKVVASDKYSWNYASSVGDRFILLRYYGPEPDTDHGGGRRSRPIRRLLRVYLFTRDSLDVVGEDVTALFQDGGHGDAEEQILDILDEYWPGSDDESVLTIEPLHPLNSSEGPPTRLPENDTGWISSWIDFEVRYVGRNFTPDD